MSLTVDQLVPFFNYGDAITNQALAIQRILRRAGFVSRIYADVIDQDKLAGLAQPAGELRNRPDQALIYHYSGYHRLLEVFRGQPGRKALVYHNVTPAGFFFNSAQSAWAGALMGRRLLAQLAEEVDLALADSAYNQRELMAAGFSRTAVLPIILDLPDWAGGPPGRGSAGGRDGRTNILFVGRLVPNKKQDELLDWFLFFQKHHQPRSRLVLAGQFFAQAGEYLAGIKERIAARPEALVDLTGPVSRELLVACYRAADLYVSFSEHEGFAVPLLEAMYCGCAVLAYDAGAVAETLDGAGVLLRSKDKAAVSALIDRLTGDAGLRQNILTGQQARIARYLDQDLAGLVRQAAADLTG